jgi:hypothetical protein
MANPLDLLKDLAAKFAGIEAALAKVTTAEERVKTLEGQLAENAKSGIKLVEDLEAEQKAHAETKASLQKAQALPVDQLPAAAVATTITGNNIAPGLDPKIKGNARLLAHFSKDKK